MNFKIKLKKIINITLDSIRIGFERNSLFKRMNDNQFFMIDFTSIKYIKSIKNKSVYLENWIHSKSKLRKDLFLLNKVEFKKSHNLKNISNYEFAMSLNFNYL